MYAAGKIPGGFFKREGRASERATLTARMIDRPIRPLWPKGFRNEVQVICTVLSRRHGHPARHPLHQRGIGSTDAVAAAVLRPCRGRAHRAHRRRTDRQPDVAAELGRDRARPDRRRHEGRPDNGRGRRRRGPRGRCCSRRSRSRMRRSRKLCEAQEDLQRQAGKPKWLDQDLSHGDRVAPTGTRSGSASRATGSLRHGAIVDELLSELAPEITMDSTDDDIQRQIQVKSSLSMLLEKQRLAAVEGPVREQFENDLRALTDAEQDSKELKSAKRHLLFDEIVSNVQLPFPVGAERRRREDCGLADSHMSRRPQRRSTRTSSARRSRSTSGGPTVAAPTRSGRSRSRWA